jgi:outer membrane protein assembly factor BamD
MFLRAMTFTRLFFAALCLMAAMPLSHADPIDDLFNFLKPSSKEEEIKPTVPAEQIYNEGLELQKREQWKSAAKKFLEIDKNEPYSEWAKKGRLMTAYSYYMAEDFEQAATAAERYIALHPGSEDIPFAKYIQGDSYYRTIPDIARDQRRTQKAITVLQELISQYPNSEYAKPAEKKLLEARDQLAGKEMDIGRFYLKQKNYLASVNRFRVVVEQYQNTRHVEEALYRLVEANLALGLVSEAQTAAAVLGHNFPQSQWYKDAYALLQQGGASPQESGDSWISRAFKGFSG